MHSIGRALFLCAALALVDRTLAFAGRPLPDTTRGVHVFNDQIATGLSPAQLHFAATRYDGTQKMTRNDADLLRAQNPDFFILHYRLGMGLGYRSTDGSCTPNGGYLGIIDTTWVQEWPGDSVVQDAWFYKWPQPNGAHVLQCQWGWYLMELDNAAWRTWWSDRVLTQLAHNDDDGLFADSFMVPNFMGGFNPSLPVVSMSFEDAWSAKLESFMSYVRGRFAGQYQLIPNVGTWVTTRDHTNFSFADGVFIEGFANDVYEMYGLEGWLTQVDRLLPLIAQGKAVIGQCYSTWSTQARMLSLATYLLIKGQHTYLNFELDQTPEWFPEYDIPIGAPLLPAPPTSLGLLHVPSGMYVREYDNGRVVVNPSDSATHTLALGATLYLAQPTGGGDVPSNGVLPASWKVDYTPVSQLTLQPGQGAVLVYDPTPYELETDVMFAGTPSAVRVHGAQPNQRQYMFMNRLGAGATPFPTLGVTLGLSGPRLGAIVVANAQGEAVWSPAFPAYIAGANLWFQAAQTGATTNIVNAHIH